MQVLDGGTFNTSCPGNGGSTFVGDATLVYVGDTGCPHNGRSMPRLVLNDVVVFKL